MTRGTFFLVGSWMVAVGVLVSSCDDEVEFTDDQGNSTKQSSSASTGGAAGMGGGGGAPFTCEECTAPENICVDELACAASCPSGREACHISATPADPSVCCDAGEQCCTAAENGYTMGDVCQPSGEGCPISCPGGDIMCPANGFCALDAETMTYSCLPACNPNYVCGTLCCPLGSTCENNTCVLPDLTIDVPQVSASFEFDTDNFPQGSCALFEGCVGGTGFRNLLRFDLRTPNIGDGDLFLGDPNGNSLFTYSPCHGHFHFNGYAKYRLLDTNMVEVASGHKQAFCLLDFEQWDSMAPNNAVYDCSYQGIQKGWADTYDSYLDCQWVDITGVPPGNYLLEIVLNEAHALGETDYTNNSTLVPVTIP